MKRKLPTFKYERVLWRKGYYVIGVDEVGRGALAGPLYVGAVCFLTNYYQQENFLGSELAFRRNVGTARSSSDLGIRGLRRHSLAQTSTSYENFLSGRKYLKYIEKLGINDSKKLSPSKRKKLAMLIKKHSFSFSTGNVSSKLIDRIGLTKAFGQASRQAIQKLRKKLNGEKIFLLVDAFYIKYLKGVGLKNQKAIIHGDEKSISIAAASIIAKVERDQTMIKLDQQYPIYFWKKNKGYGTKQHINAIKLNGPSKLHRKSFLRKIL